MLSNSLTTSVNFTTSSSSTAAAISWHKDKLLYQDSENKDNNEIIKNATMIKEVETLLKIASYSNLKDNIINAKR
jgi:hypothetical protein